MLNTLKLSFVSQVGSRQHGHKPVAYTAEDVLGINSLCFLTFTCGLGKSLTDVAKHVGYYCVLVQPGELSFLAGGESSGACMHQDF